MQRIYVMKPRYYKRLLTLRKTDKVVCERCGKPILPGQKVMAKLAANGKTKYYHLTCWRKLFIDI